MRRLTTAVLVVALLGGCVTTTRKTIYVKPGVSEEQKKKDEAECVQAAIDTAGPRGVHRGRPGDGGPVYAPAGLHTGADRRVAAQDGWGAGRRQKNTRETGCLARDFCADSI